MNNSPQNHHRKSIRLKEYDYSNPNWYFITICTDNKICSFGRIKNGKMVLNKLGKIVEQCWITIPEHFKNTSLDSFDIMPNHIHGIIIIDSRGKACLAPTDSLNKFGKPVVGSLSTIIGSFKSAVAKHINKTIRSKKKSIWQRNYYEHIVRNELDLFHISSYIETNPLKWELDEYYNML